jgi:HEAT repeat protein
MVGVSHKSIWLATCLIIGLFIFCLRLSSVENQDVSPDTELQRAMAQLGSSDELVRAEAKAKLLAMGDRPIKPLICRLNQLVNNPEALCIPENKKKEASQSDEVLITPMSAHLKSILKNDLYELLGRLHAKEAVPLLISIMEQEEISDLIQGMTPVMRALAEIGPAAVPEIIESLESAEATASAQLISSSGLAEDERQRRLDWATGRIQLRNVLVLREIGSPEAIPYLEELRAKTSNEFIIREVQSAIKKIQDKAN